MKNWRPFLTVQYLTQVGSQCVDGGIWWHFGLPQSLIPASCISSSPSYSLPAGASTSWSAPFHLSLGCQSLSYWATFYMLLLPLDGEKNPCTIRFSPLHLHRGELSARQWRIGEARGSLASCLLIIPYSSTSNSCKIWRSHL